MKKRYALFIIMMISLFTGGCAGTGIETGAAPVPAAIDGHYARDLGGDYARQAQRMAANGHDDVAAKFNDKAAQAADGIWAAPESPVPQDGDMVRAYAVLTGALFAAMDAANAPFLAHAQVNYDCWRMLGSTDCRRLFEKAMRSVDVPRAAVRTESVYFDAQSSILSAATHKTLVALARMMRMNKGVHAHLVGMTDQRDNPSLALRRAIAVRNAMVQMGVVPDRIDVKDETRTDTLLSQQTPETGSDAAKRRVDIILEQLVGQAI